MKLLSWMRTIKQYRLDPSKESKGDFCRVRAQVSSKVQDIRTNSFSFSGPSHDPKPPHIDEELWFDEDGFSGFLAIGTLGRDPETPKFPASIAEEDETGAQKEMTKLINEKLDKFLEEYAEDGRSKQVERSNAEGDREPHVCPSQGYDLFRSSMELTRSNGVKKKKGLLTNVFKRRKTVEGECNSVEKHGTRYLIQRIFEKLHGSSTKTRNVSVPKKKDLTKNVQIYRSKVHPVLYSPARDDNEIDERRSCINRCNIKIPSRNGGSLVSSSISEANMKRENWIKTDAEYLVLEL